MDDIEKFLDTVNKELQELTAVSIPAATLESEQDLVHYIKSVDNKMHTLEMRRRELQNIYNQAIKEAQEEDDSHITFE